MNEETRLKPNELCPMYRTMDDLRDRAEAEVQQLGWENTKCITDACNTMWHFTLNAKKKIEYWDDEAKKMKYKLDWVGEVLTSMCPAYREYWVEHIKETEAVEGWVHFVDRKRMEGKNEL